MRPIIFLILVIWQISCISVEQINPVPNYSVYSILNPSDSIIKVFVAKTYGIEEYFSIDSLKYISNGKVILESENKISKQLFLNKNTKEYVALNDGFLKPGKRYYLTIIIKKDTISSNTKIPEYSEIKVELNNVQNNIGQVIVSWNKTIEPNSQNYRLLGSVNTNSPITPGFFWGEDLFLNKINGKNVSGNNVVSPLGSFDFTSFSNANVLVELEVLDSGLYDFREKLDAIQIQTSFTKKFEAPIFFNSNIDNAVGVFGSMTHSEITINLHK